MRDGIRGRSIDRTVPKCHGEWCLGKKIRHSKIVAQRSMANCGDHRQTGKKFETNPRTRLNQFN